MLRVVINVLSDINCISPYWVWLQRIFKTQNIIFLRGTKMDLIGFDSIALRLKRHQQMVSISDVRFQHSFTSLLHRLPLSRIPFADDGIPNESDGISGESEPHSNQISRRTVTDEVASSIWPIHCHQLDQLLLHGSLPFF